MRFTQLRFCLAGTCLFTAGCLLSPQTRLPTLYPRDPRLERRLYEFHDPFPDENLGPETSGRPRSFSVPRTEPRRALEFRMLQGLRPEAEPSGPRLPRNQWSYPDSVPE